MKFPQGSSEGSSPTHNIPQHPIHRYFDTFSLCFQYLPRRQVAPLGRKKPTAKRESSIQRYLGGTFSIHRRKNVGLSTYGSNNQNCVDFRCNLLKLYGARAEKMLDGFLCRLSFTLFNCLWRNPWENFE